MQPHSPEPVRVVHASAGLRRVAALAYMLMWSWERNVSYADSQGLDRAQNVILILDEIEAHLHSRWQRSILHSVIHVMENLHAKANVQVIASTHSPMVLASAEPFFDGAMSTSGRTTDSPRPSSTAGGATSGSCWIRW